MSPDGSTQVGKISKQWSGLLREAFTDTDYFGVSFPMDLDVRMKAVLIGAVFLIVSITHVYILLYNINKNLIIFEYRFVLFVQNLFRQKKKFLLLVLQISF